MTIGVSAKRAHDQSITSANDTLGPDMGRAQRVCKAFIK